eukprot:SAG11_NODE_32696_length_281_cov_1.357143_1_plen_44_part_10
MRERYTPKILKKIFRCDVVEKCGGVEVGGPYHLNDISLIYTIAN